MIKSPRINIVDLSIRPYLDIEHLKSQYEEGCWLYWDLKLVDLNYIEFGSWNSRRHFKALTELQSLGMCYPVFLDDATDEHTAKRELIDGNHRCQAAYDLGYTHIPTWVNVERKDPPGVMSYEDEVEKWRDIAEALNSTLL